MKLLEKDPAARFSSCGAFLKALDAQTARTGSPVSVSITSWLRKPAVIIPGVALLLAAALGVFRFVDGNARAARARDTVLPELRRAVNQTSFTVSLDTYHRGKEAQELLGDDPEFLALWNNIVSSTDITTTPPGARVWYRQYGAADTTWRFLGETPVEGAEFPRAFIEWRITKPGYHPVRDAAILLVMDFKVGALVPRKLHYDLDTIGSIPPGMVKVDRDTTLGVFFIDRCEVTNREFREFVRAGGYENPDYWKHPFVKDGKPVTREATLGGFTDLTGRSGPATWRAGDFPQGEEDFPVTGISWYEAAAYAAFVGKELPAADHWRAATGWDIGVNWFHINKFIIPASNFSGTGLRPVASSGAAGPYGMYDLAGNAREWCWNPTNLGRCLRGGAWNDATYMFSNISQSPPLDRSEKNGFRCMLVPKGSPRPRRSWDPISQEKPQDLYSARPVSEEVFDTFRRLYSYDATPLHARLEFADSASADWRLEEFGFTGPRSGERMRALLFLPRAGSPPFQTVVYWPGAGVTEGLPTRNLTRSPEFRMNFDFLLKNGRAMCVPVCIGMFERSMPDSTWDAMGPYELSNYRFQAVREFRRALDYLDSRPDIDTSALAYFGNSWGGAYGNLVLAVEPRFRAAVLKVGGHYVYSKTRPEVDFRNYVGRIRLPVLMLNGQFDMTFPLELAVRPMFDLLGTPAKDKRLVVYPTDHFVPTDEFMKETLAWLDRYLGPVKYSRAPFSEN
jgi:pimeloyl-ACP methyl ester carboxylesterase